MPFLQEAQGTNASHSTFIDVGGDNITNNTYIGKPPETKEIIAALKPVKRGSYHVRTCTTGTRKSIFEKISSWVEDLQVPNILWLSGSPGAGKSAIAATLVSKLANEGRLGASLFFQRGDATLSDPVSVWRTIAFDLARFPAVAYSLVNDIKDGHLDPERANIESQFNYMIEEALTMKKALKRNEEALRQNREASKQNKEALKRSEDALKENTDAPMKNTAKRPDMEAKRTDITAKLEESKDQLEKTSSGTEEQEELKRDILGKQQKALEEEREALVNTQRALSTHSEELKKLQFVIVLDALDECGWESSQSEQRRTFLDSLTKWSSLSSRFKLIVTSRDEGIPRSFRDVCERIELLTGSLATSEDESDIAHFFRVSFVAISEDYPTLLNWPGESTIGQLTAHAEGLFIWAETVVRFVDNGKDAPDEQLNLVLRGGLGEGGDAITTLYRRILDVSFQGWNGHMLDALRTVLGTIILTKVPLHRDDLQHFFGTMVSTTQVDLILKKLSSVISIGKADNVLHICHLSFSEFLCDSSQCPPSFRINRALHSRNLAAACFRLMEGRLHFGMHDLVVSWMHNDSIMDLAGRLEKSFPSPTYSQVIPFRCLLYSSCFWAEHLWDTWHDSSIRYDLLSEVKDFLYIRLFYWLEFMSLLNEESTSLSAFPLVIQWIGTSDTELQMFAQDAMSCVIDIWSPDQGNTILSQGAKIPDANSSLLDAIWFNQSNTYINTLTEEERILATLKPAQLHGYYVQPCMEGTRASVFREIDNWLEDAEAPNILWLRGCPGAGKSAIASSLVTRLRTKGRISGSFFFLRNDANFADPAVAWRMVAASLAECHPTLASSLVGVVKECAMNPERVDIESQFNYMIQETLTLDRVWKRTVDALKQRRDALSLHEVAVKRNHDALAMSENELGLTLTTDLQTLRKILQIVAEAKVLSATGKLLAEDEKALSEKLATLAKFRGELKLLKPVVVLDALDNCGWETSQSDQRRTFLDSLMKWDLLPRTFKLVITSRDQGVPHSLRNACKRIDLLSGSRVTPEAGDDIQLFLRTRFAQVADLYPTISTSRPGDSVIPQLASHIAGLFILAEAVARLMEQGVHDGQFDLLPDGNFGEEGDVIRYTYREILDDSFRDTKYLLKAFPAVVGTIILAKAPLQLRDLPYFMIAPIQELQTDLILNELSSVISVIGTERLLYICHPTFVEFLCDSRLCPKPFVINRAKHNWTFAFACLRLMKEGLGFNLCGLESADLRNDDIPDFPSWIMRSISSHLLYSCRFWAEHLLEAPGELICGNFLDEFKDFFHTHLHHWLEVMSLIKEVHTTSATLLSISRWARDLDPELSMLVADMSKFVDKHSAQISRSALHIYTIWDDFTPGIPNEPAVPSANDVLSRFAECTPAHDQPGEQVNHGTTAVPAQTYVVSSQDVGFILICPVLMVMYLASIRFIA